MFPKAILVCFGLFLCCNTESSQNIKKITKVNSLKKRDTRGVNDLTINIAVPIGPSGQPEEYAPVVINFENTGAYFAIDTGTVLKNGTEDVSADFSDCFGDVPSGRSSCISTYSITATDLDAGMVTFAITLSSTSGEVKDFGTLPVPLGTYISGKMTAAGVDATDPDNPVGVFAGKAVPVEIAITNVEAENIADVVIADEKGTSIGEAEEVVPDESLIADSKLIADSTFDVIGTEYTVKLTNTEDVEVYRLYTLFTEAITGTYRINWGCLCDDDLSTTHILVGSYNDGVNNTIKGWEFNEISESCVTLTSSINLGDSTILNKAVYNTVDSFDNNVIYLAYVTQAPDQDCVLNLAKCSLNGDSYEFTVGDTTGLSSICSKVQWILDSNDIPYVAVDCDNEIRVYPIGLSDLSFGAYFSTANKSLGNASTFLYWLPQGNLYLIQGFGAATVSTYKTDLLAHTIESGVDTNLSGTFSQVNACATCNNYLILGGSNTEVSKNGVLKQYTVKTTDPNKGALVATSLMETIETTSTINYCELCCCNGSNLLVGTDKGLFSYDPDTLSLISSNTLLPNNNWNNTSWCCVNNDYCAAVNNDAQAYILKQESGSFIVTCTL